MGRSLAPPGRGRGAAPWRRALHRRPRARPARMACGDRPLAARARILSVDASAALDAPGVRGVLTGEDVAALSRPFPAGSGHHALGRGARTRPATSASRLRWSSPRNGTSPRTRPSWWPSTTSRSRPHRSTAAEAIHSASSTMATSTTPSRRPISSSGRRSGCRASGLPVECYGVVCDWDDPAELAPGRTSGASHAARRRGRRPRTPRRPAAVADATPTRAARSASRRRSPPSLHAACRVRGARAGCPGALDEDHMEHLAASCAATGRVAEKIAGRFHTQRANRGASLRRARGRRRLHAGPRAGHALPDARVAVGWLRVRNVAARNRVVAANTVPLGVADSRVQQAAALLRARADAGDRRPQARDRPGRGATQHNLVQGNTVTGNRHPSSHYPPA